MDEAKRLATLSRYNVVDTLPERAFDDLVGLAADICGTQYALITLIEENRAWFKAAVGTELKESSRCVSFCDYTIRESNILVIPDTRVDDRSKANPLVTGELNIQFYAGAPLIAPDGSRIGAICVLDSAPGELNEMQKRSLSRLAGQVIQLLEARLQSRAQSDSTHIVELLNEQLEKNHEFLDAVLENLADGIVACNDKGELTLFNRATREFHGLDPSKDIPAGQWSEHYRLFKGDGETLFPMDEVPLLRAFNGEAIKDVEMVIAPLNGPKKHILASGRALVGKDGRKLGAVCAMHDVTEAKMAMARFEAATNNLQSLIDTCPVGISVLDKNSNVTMWNPGCEKIYGWSKAEVIGKPLPFYEEDQKEEVGLMIQAVKLARQKVSLQVNRKRKDGRMVAVQVSLVPIIDEKNEIDGIMSVVVDISDLKQREKDLTETNRALRAATLAKSEFLANMSHEIRTPLNGVIGMTELVLDQGLTPQQRTYIEVIQTSAENLLKIISDILDFSKIEAGKLDIETIPFDLEFVLEGVHRTLEQTAKAKGLSLNRSIAGDINSKFLGDPSRIRQILVNLINNAIKFTTHGSVSTAVKVEKLAAGRTKIRVEVSDTGVGISQEAVGRLFQAFSQADSSTTRRFGGTGLGLSISKRLVELMDGEIGVTSEVGKGSCFWFSLELKPNLEVVPSPAKRLPSSQRAAISDYPLKILLAEDNPINRLIAVEMLARLGLSADQVVNGKEALAHLASAHYDLVLMDCQMPELDGYEATKQIRSNTHMANWNVSIVALTANAMNGDREECLAVGMNDYLSKPMKLDELEAVIRRNVKPQKTAAS